jgi:hypothetical protein
MAIALSPMPIGGGWHARYHHILLQFPCRLCPIRSMTSPETLTEQNACHSHSPRHEIAKPGETELCPTLRLPACRSGLRCVTYPSGVKDNEGTLWARVDSDQWRPLDSSCYLLFWNGSCLSALCSSRCSDGCHSRRHSHRREY